jgi:hypothetical protein
MSSIRQFDRSLLQKCLAVTFVLVMAGLGFIQAVHVHDAMVRPTSPASHCSLCVVAHHAVLVTPANSAPEPIVTASVPEITAVQFELPVQNGASFIRPPPQSL